MQTFVCVALLCKGTIQDIYKNISKTYQNGQFYSEKTYFNPIRIQINLFTHTLPFNKEKLISISTPKAFHRNTIIHSFVLKFNY